MNERIKKLRKALDLTQQEFADRIGMKRNTVANYETDRNKPSNSVISLICKAFDVNEEWLRTGEGEMFGPKPTAALEALARERGLSHGDYVLIEKFLNLKPQSRLAVVEYMIEVAAALNDSITSLDQVTAMKHTDIDAEVDDYRIGLLVDRDLAARQEAEWQAMMKPPQEMSDTELHAELGRQISEEKKQADDQSASGRGKSGTG